MSTEPTPNSVESSSDGLSKTTSELSNLLQIISGASAMLEQPGSEAEPYRTMLRQSIERAEKIAADLSERAGGTSKATASHPDLAPFMRPRKSGSSDGLPTQRILLVDDEQMTLTLIKRVLSDAGFEVTTAQSGFECLDQFRQRPHGFSLVLLDLTMPFMDGEETFRRLKEIRPDVPVLLCTGFIQQERLDLLMTSGMAGFLRKPVPPDEIIAMVRATLASVRYAGGTNPSGISAAM